jgi:hypothetical protein
MVVFAFGEAHRSAEPLITTNNACPMAHQDPSEHLVLTRVRPRFQVETSLSIEEVESRIQQSLEAADAPCRGHVRKGYAALQLPVQDQHYWSPRLVITLEEREEAGTQGCKIRGLYGPRHEVWTMFVFFYALIGFGILMVAMIGGSRASLGRPSSILWALPVLVLVFASLWLVSYSGQKLGSKQMHVLHEFLEKSVGLEI